MDERRRPGSVRDPPAGGAARHLGRADREQELETEFGGLSLSVRGAPKSGIHPLAEAADHRVKFLGERGFRVEIREALTLSGHPGVALRAWSETHKFGWNVRLYETADRLYVLSVIGGRDELNGPLAQKFFQSFRITE